MPINVTFIIGKKGKWLLIMPTMTNDYDILGKKYHLLKTFVEQTHHHISISKEVPFCAA